MRIIPALIASALVLAGCGSKNSSSERTYEKETSATATPAAQTIRDREGGSKLTFRMGLDRDGAALFNEKNVLKAEPVVMQDQEGKSVYCVSLELDEEGAEIFANATSEAAENGVPISIWYGDELISAPSVSEAVTDGKAIISGDFTLDSATELARKIDPETREEENSKENE